MPLDTCINTFIHMQMHTVPLWIFPVCTVGVALTYSLHLAGTDIRREALRNCSRASTAIIITITVTVPTVRCHWLQAV